ncbi:dicarboxylate/amino acid:cation symporter [Lachnospiraceae bacterium LCP25S3_G4]
MKTKKIGLVPKLIIGIILGIFIGSFAPEIIVQLLVTLSSIFSVFLKFVIPFIIIGFVAAGIADLASGAGKLLGITVGIAYGSTIIAGFLAYIVASNVFPYFMDASQVSKIGDPEAGMLSPIFTIPLAPMVEVTAAIVFAFILGLGISALRTRNIGSSLYGVVQDFQQIVTLTLSTIIIPLLPLYIAGTFANITYAGQVWNIINVFWKVFLIVIPLHLIYITLQFLVAGAINKKNPFTMLKNQLPGYLTAIGTQSSAATIPVNVQCAEKNGTSKEIREFTIPLCATIHLSGSIISVTSFGVAVLMMNGMDYGITKMFPFILMLGVAMVAAPGAPGGAIMSALPFLPMIGIPSDGGLASLMIALYLTQDSFGTAANVSGDNAIAAIIDYLNDTFIKKKEHNV